MPPDGIRCGDGSRLCSHRYRGNCANVVDTAGDAANGGRRDPGSSAPGAPPTTTTTTTILTQPAAKNAAGTGPESTVAAAAEASVNALRVVLLLPTEQPLLRRAAGSVRDGALAVFSARKQDVVVIDCAYPTDAVVATYSRCVDDSVDWVIGPPESSGRRRVDSSQVARRTPHLDAVAAGAPPAAPLSALAPDLESRR